VDSASKKAFPVLGIVIGSITLVLSAALIVIGLRMAGSLG
jgi:hypothetical protein